MINQSITSETPGGYLIQNGGGWNDHKTARSLLAMESEGRLPEIPTGYVVCCAPVSDKPFGYRVALVRIMGRKTEIVDGETLDDGPDEFEGDRSQWVNSYFDLDGVVVKSSLAEQQGEDSSEWCIRTVCLAITFLPVVSQK